MTELEKIIHYKFINSRWLETSRNHKSFVNEARSGDDNEKLEFIGDAVLAIVLAEILYLSFPKDNEGDLSKKRASLVNEVTLSDLALELKLMPFLNLGRGESQAPIESRPRLLASFLEAIIGAVYLDGGFENAKKVILGIFEGRLKDEKLILNYDQDFKSRLQEHLQKKLKEAPVYEVTEEKGSAHEPTFKIQVKIQGRILAEAEGRSKKEAEQRAAQAALKIENGEFNG